MEAFRRREYMILIAEGPSTKTLIAPHLYHLILYFLIPNFFSYKNKPERSFA